MGNFTGTSGNDSLTGSSHDDTFDMTAGGTDTVSGLDGNDTVDFGATFAPGDHVDGGAGIDTVKFSAGFGNFTSTTILNVEFLVLSGTSQIGIREADGNVAAGQTLTVDASGMGAGGLLSFEGRLETDGNFHLIGSDGNDVLRGGAGNDTIDGGAGDDLLRGIGGVDTYNGGAGFDRVSFLDATGGETTGAVADLRTQTISNDGYGNAETMSSIEAFGVGTFYADTFYGDDNANQASADLSDSVYAFGGDDVLYVDGAPSIVDGGAGFDQAIFQGLETIDVFGDTGTATQGISVDLAAGTINNDGFGNTGAIAGIEKVVIMIGDSTYDFADTLLGSAGDDVLMTGDGVTITGPGSDTLKGRNGNDMLSAGWDADRLDGGKGDDTLVGAGGGGDKMTGGQGSDVFQFAVVYDSTEGRGVARITDFTSGQDKLDLWFTPNAIDADVSTDKLKHLGSAADAAHLAANDALLAHVGTHTYLIVDANGVAGYQAGADFLIRLDGVTSVQLTDFT
jgi:Ca2+-binding RTX toxin-like protein